MCRIGVLVLVVLTVTMKIIAQDIEFNDQVYSSATKDTIPGYQQYIRHIYSMINSYRSDVLGGRVVIETNSMIEDTKYKTWKRNADLINSLLSLPKGMNDAGR